MSPLVEGWACGALTVLGLVIGVGRAIQRISDAWRDDAAHRRATPAIRRRAYRVTRDGVQILLLALGIAVVAVAILITDK